MAELTIQVTGNISTDKIAITGSKSAKIEGVAVKSKVTIAGPPGKDGDKGDKGDTGIGVPTGGSARQVLVKLDGADYNTGFDDLNADDIVDGSINRSYTNTEKTKLAGVQSGAQVNAVASVAGKTGAITLVKTDVSGIDQLDNTSDVNKPVSTAQQAAITAAKKQSLLMAIAL